MTGRRMHRAFFRLMRSALFPCFVLACGPSPRPEVPRTEPRQARSRHEPAASHEPRCAEVAPQHIEQGSGLSCEPWSEEGAVGLRMEEIDTGVERAVECRRATIEAEQGSSVTCDHAVIGGVPIVYIAEEIQLVHRPCTDEGACPEGASFVWVFDPQFRLLGTFADPRGFWRGVEGGVLTTEHERRTLRDGALVAPP